MVIPKGIPISSVLAYLLPIDWAPQSDLLLIPTLVNSFFLPAKDPGSPECLNQIYTNDAGKTPMELFEDERYKLPVFSNLPIHLVWGNDDPITPTEGGLANYYISMAQEYAAASKTNTDDDNDDNDTIPKVSLEFVTAGHIPFDEAPKVCHSSMHQWLNKLFQN